MRKLETSREPQRAILGKISDRELGSGKSQGRRPKEVKDTREESKKRVWIKGRCGKDWN